MKLREGYDMEQMTKDSKKPGAGQAHSVDQYQALIDARMGIKR